MLIADALLNASISHFDIYSFFPMQNGTYKAYVDRWETKTTKNAEPFTSTSFVANVCVWNITIE